MALLPHFPITPQPLPSALHPTQGTNNLFVAVFTGHFHSMWCVMPPSSFECTFLLASMMHYAFERHIPV